MVTRGSAGRRWIVAVAAGSALALGAGCTWPAQVALGGPGATEGAAPTPDPAAVAPETPHGCPDRPARACLLPFPSERWQVPDPASATGFRLDVPADVLPTDVTDQLGPGAGVNDAFAGADGFSPLSPIVFDLPMPLDPAALPSDGGTVLAVTDTTTGESVPLRAEVSRDALPLGKPRGIVLAWPLTVWPYGHRVQARFAAPGQDVQWTAFQVRSRQNAVGNLDALVGAVRADAHPVRNLRAAPSLVERTRVVTGEVALSDFRDADGVVSRSSDPRSHRTWTTFLMVLPDHPAAPSAAPVVIYGHGIGATKETMIVNVAANAGRGAATIGIDIPDHGTRSDDGFVMDIANPRQLGRLVGMVLQGELDQLSLLLAVRSPEFVEALTQLDPSLRVDPRHTLYEGTSMGGFLGASFLAMAPEVDAAFLQVPGSGIIDTIFHSLLWAAFSGVVPVHVSPGEHHALIGVAAMLLDRGDNANVADRVVALGTPVRIVYGANDGIVPNPDTDRLMALFDIPLAGEHKSPARGVRTLASVDRSDPRIATQIDTWGEQMSPLGPALTHVSFMDQTPMVDLDAWLVGVLTHGG